GRTIGVPAPVAVVTIGTNLHGRHASILGDAGLHVVDEAGPHVTIEGLLLAGVPDPGRAHRAHRDQRTKRPFKRRRVLNAKATADVRGNDAYFLLREAEHFGQTALDLERLLS